MAENLRCEWPIELIERDPQGKPIVYHKKCGKPAALRTVVGMLTSVRACLCDEHAAHVDWNTSVSTLGYRLGQIDKKAAGHDQMRLPGTGVVK